MLAETLADHVAAPRGPSPWVNDFCLQGEGGSDGRVDKTNTHQSVSRAPRLETLRKIILILTQVIQGASAVKPTWKSHLLLLQVIQDASAVKTYMGESLACSSGTSGCICC